MKSDYDQRMALSALMKHNGAAVDGDTLAPALAHIKSSYDKRMVLEEMLKRGTLSVDAKKTVLLAVAGMQSDYDRRQVLTAYFARFGVEPRAAGPVLRRGARDQVELRSPRSADRPGEEGIVGAARSRTPCSTPSVR